MRAPHRRSARRSSPARSSPLVQLAETIALHPPRALGRRAATRPACAGEEIPLDGPHLRDLRRLRRAASPTRPYKQAWTLDEALARSSRRARRATSTRGSSTSSSALADELEAHAPPGHPAAGGRAGAGAGRPAGGRPRLTRLRDLLARAARPGRSQHHGPARRVQPHADVGAVAAAHLGLPRTRRHAARARAGRGGRRRRR